MPELIWSPHVIEALDQQELNLYVQFAATPCIPGGGCTIDEALRVLYQAEGDIHSAVQQLLKHPPTKQSIWTMNEVQNFERLKMLHGKDFYLISQMLQTKTRDEVVDFYYKWKKSALRNRSLGSPQASTNSLASVSSVTSSSLTTTASVASISHSPRYIQLITQTPTTATNNLSLLSSALAVTPSTSSSTTSDESRDSGRGEELLMSFVEQYGNNIHAHQEQPKSSLLTPPSETFPCKVCGRVFEKVKSRSAHMKRHKNERLYSSK